MPTSSGRSHLLFFVPSLGGGGAEKHLVRLANHLDRERFRVTVAVVRSGGSYEVELEDDVDVVPVGASRLATSGRALAGVIDRHAVDLVFAATDPAICVAVAARRLSKRRPAIVAGVQNTPSINLRRGLGRRIILAALPFIYPRAEHVVALSRGVAEDVASVAPAVGDRVTVIHNAGSDAEVERLAGERLPDDVPRRTDGPLLVACGRLIEQKGYPHLLDAFRLVRARFPDAQLWIVGDGVLRETLQARCRDLGISDSVWFAGFRDNPYAFMRAADAFVLSSLWEGFGNVVVEAMASGTAVVATDCPHGPAEILQGGRCGMLVPPGDGRALGAALVRVVGDRGLRARLVEAARERARDFSATRIAEEYGALFAGVSARRSGEPHLRSRAGAVQPVGSRNPLSPP